MTDIFKLYAVEENLAENGVWVTFRNKIRFKVRSSKSKIYKETSKKIMKQARKMQRQGTEMPEEAANQLMIEIVLKALLVDWEGVKSDGEDLAFIPNNVRKVLSIEEIRQFIANIADDITLYQNDEDDGEDLEDDEKNS